MIYIHRHWQESAFALLCFSFLLLFGPAAIAQNTQLSVGSGTNLTIGGGNMVLQNTDLHSDGSIASAGTVLITGNSNSVIAGGGTVQFNNLTLNTGPAYTLSLGCPVSVTQNLLFQNGLIDLNNQALQLGTSGTLVSENETSHLTGLSGGTVNASYSSAGIPSLLNIGNLGAVLSNPLSFGTLDISRTHKPASNPNHSLLKSIDRVYFIQPTNNSALNATLRFYYLDAELESHDPNSLTLWKSEDGIKWTQTGADTRNPAEKWVEKTGITDFSYWTLSDDANPLPISLISFRVACENGYADVSWQTGLEGDLNDFIVQRISGNGNWQDIGEVAATNAANGAVYRFRDKDPVPAGSYRLKIVDLTGLTSFSPVFQGGCADVTLPFLVYPNPAQNQAVVSVALRSAANGQLQVLSVTGQEVFRMERPLVAGKNELLLPVSGLAAGQYIVRLLLPDKTLQTKLIKQ